MGIDKEKLIEDIKKEIHDSEWAEEDYPVIHIQLLRDTLKLLEDGERIVHCADCVKREYDNCPFNEFTGYFPKADFFCAEGRLTWNDTTKD